MQDLRHQVVGNTHSALPWSMNWSSAAGYEEVWLVCRGAIINTLMANRRHMASIVIWLDSRDAIWRFLTQKKSEELLNFEIINCNGSEWR